MTYINQMEISHSNKNLKIVPQCRTHHGALAKPSLEILTVVFHWGSVFVSVSGSVCVWGTVWTCVYVTERVREKGEHVWQEEKERRKEDKQRAEKGVSPVGLWVIQSTQWGDGDWQTGDLTFPRMLFMALIMDLMLPWRPSIPGSRFIF